MPLTAAAIAALDAVPGSDRLGLRVREHPRAARSTSTTSATGMWIPAVDVGGGREAGTAVRPSVSTFASNALAAGITTFELARIMGTSVGMIEAHYGALIDTAHDAILTRLEAIGGF